MAQLASLLMLPAPQQEHAGSKAAKGNELLRKWYSKIANSH